MAVRSVLPRNAVTLTWIFYLIFLSLTVTFWVDVSNKHILFSDGMSDTSKAILLVADISGYTSFMKQHVVSVNHAKQIIVRLLKSLMTASKPPLQVAELEGDAVFFYALSKENELEATAQHVKEQVVQFFAAFKRELDEIDNVKTCSCHACDHTHDLQLKQVVHVGEVAIEQIGRFEKLFGLDVILVHRMLKNSVPSKEYVMMTERLYKNMREFFGLEPERRKETFEGVGEVETLVFYPSRLSPARNTEVLPPAGIVEKLAWRAEITTGFMMDYLGLKKGKGEFKNFPS